MNVLPLVDRELRVALRRSLHYRLRLAAGGGGMLVTFWMATVSTAKLGHTLLQIITGIIFVFGILAGVLLTADCLSQEKREGTLGLLFLTDLQSADVVFGKLVAKAVVPFFTLLATFPALAICVLFGGVTGGEFWRLNLVLGNTLFFSLSICLLTSLLCEEQRLAHLIALLVMLLLVGAIPVTGSALSAWLNDASWRSLSLLFSPAGTYILASDSIYQGAAIYFWASLFITLAMAWVCLGAACIILPKAWQDARGGFSVRPSVQRDRFRRRKFTHGARGPIRMLATNPITWLASRRRARSALLWLLPGVVVSVCDFSATPFGNGRHPLSFGVIALVHLFFKMWLAGCTAYAFARDRQTGALEMLLGTPLQPAEIGKDMLRAYRNEFGPPLVALVLVDLSLAGIAGTAGDWPSAFFLVAAAASTVFDSCCICWIGLWRGVASRSPALATFSTIATSLIFPCLWTAGGVVIFLRSTASEFLALWLFLNTINNAIFLIRARDGFLEYFRTLALRPFGEKAPTVKSRWSPINWEDENSIDEASRELCDT